MRLKWGMGNQTPSPCSTPLSLLKKGYNTRTPQVVTGRKTGVRSEMFGDHAGLANAIALNSSMVNGAWLIEPSMAGMIIVVAGEV